MKNKSLKGFTLIELLIVIGIIAILAGIVLVAVNPAQQFGKANDSERKSEIGTVLSAVYQFQTSPTARGALPQCQTGAGNVATDIPDCGTNFDGAYELGTADEAFDCSVAFATGGLVPSYLREIPIDPSGLPTYDAANTGYYICQDAAAVPPRVYVLSAGVEVFTNDGGCTMVCGGVGEPACRPSEAGPTQDVMCVSG